MQHGHTMDEQMYVDDPVKQGLFESPFMGWGSGESRSGEGALRYQTSTRSDGMLKIYCGFLYITQKMCDFSLYFCQKTAGFPHFTNKGESGRYAAHLAARSSMFGGLV